MNWYVVKIVFRIISGDGKHDAQFDEQLRLINAEDDKQAYLKAKTIGMDSQESFMNSRQQPVRWEFIDVAEINPIVDLIDGAELYYHIHEPADADVYEAWAHHRSALLSTNS